MDKTRVVNVRHDDYDVYIGRTMRDGKYVDQGWGNPYRVLRGESPIRAIDTYRSYILSKPALLDRLPELRGKTLGCWCAPEGGIEGNIHGVTCHGEILAALADDPDLLARLRAETEHMNSQIAALLTRMVEGKCPHCGAKVEREQQVGRCVYAEPCGHRLYQGKTLERAEREHKEREAMRDLPPHEHAWTAWGSDARYERCASCGQVRRR